MIRRVIAALLAIVLAAVGIALVVNYANRADERALGDMEAQTVFVAAKAIQEGTKATDLSALVETKDVPRQFVVDGAVTDLKQIDGRVAVTDIAPGEQLQTARFATPDELRTRGDFALPEEAKNYHQVTIPLENPRALGGSIAAGDRVGVFGSFEVKTDEKYGIDERGNLVPQTAAGEDKEEDTVPVTDLLLHKALVVRVEGGYVAPPAQLQEGEENAEEQQAADTINVTLALPAEQAAQVIFTKEYGQLWLTLEPEGADDEPVKAIVLTVPRTGKAAVQ